MIEWSETDSELYRRLAPAAVPHRAEQMATLLSLLPFGPDDSFRVVEVGCGEGYLAQALLTCFPQARLMALDGSAEMRTHAEKRLSGFGWRATVAPLILTQPDWLATVDGADCVVSSLAVHHLNGPQKRVLFDSLARRLSARGALLIADLVEPQRAEVRALFASTWDYLAERQSRAATGSTVLFDLFQQTEWNYYHFDDPADTPSPLFDQLVWLKEAGFAVVDCFWLQAGHAIYGGYKNPAGESGVSFEKAQTAVQMALNSRGD
jgi:tRNA (cmo5U34)-methyltransferase